MATTFKKKEKKGNGAEKKAKKGNIFIQFFCDGQKFLYFFCPAGKIFILPFLNLSLNYVRKLVFLKYFLSHILIFSSPSFENWKYIVVT
jgi:hypothetical protein